MLRGVFSSRAGVKNSYYRCTVPKFDPIYPWSHQIGTGCVTGKKAPCKRFGILGIWGEM